MDSKLANLLGALLTKQDERMLVLAYEKGASLGSLSRKIFRPSTIHHLKNWGIPIAATAAMGAMMGGIMPGKEEQHVARMGRGALFGGSLGAMIAALRGHEFQSNIPWLLPLFATAPWIIGDPHEQRKS